MYIVRYKDTKEIIRKSETPISLTGDVQGLDPNIEIIQEVILAAPAFDPTTEKAQAISSEKDGVLTHSYEVVPLSADDLAAIKTIQARAEARQRALKNIITLKDDPIGSILYDLAVSRGEIVNGEIISLPN